MNIYSKLRAEVISSVYQGLFLVNQEDDVNIPNSFKKKGWKHFRDGGAVAKCSKNYEAYYTFDYGLPSNWKKKLTFFSYNNKSGLNLLDFIETVLHANPSIFTKTEGLVLKDARKYLFEITSLQINDTFVDATVIILIKRYFPNLEQIKFNKSIISRACNFDKITADLEFIDCEIESIRIFNECKVNLRFIRVKIFNIVPTVICSKEISIFYGSLATQKGLKELFLKCSFPTLLVLKMHTKEINDYSLEDSFLFLPYSASNLEELRIDCKVKSLDFLIQLKHIRVCTISSISDDQCLTYTNITDKKEHQKILERNKKEYEIQKILNPYQEDKYIIDQLEKNRILKIAHFGSLLSFTSEEEQKLKENNYLEYALQKNKNSEVPYYYVSYYDQLYYNRAATEEEVLFENAPRYKIENNILYSFTFNSYKKSKIVKTRNFIYRIDGTPILFEHIRKPIHSVKDAEYFMKDQKVHYFNLDEFNYQGILDELKNWDEEDDWSIGEFIDWVEEKFHIIIDESFFKHFGSSAKNICGLFFRYEKALKRLKDLESKKEEYKRRITELILINYDKFNIEEKAFLCTRDYLKTPASDTDYFFLNLYLQIIDCNQNELLKSIDEKNNQLYSRYLKFLKLIDTQYYIFEKPYDMKINPEYIRQLKL